MNKVDITKTYLPIVNIYNVLPTRMTKPKNINVCGRHSDAFCLITDGSCTYTFEEDGYSITVRKGDILYLAKNAVYQMTIQTPLYQGIYCDFDFARNEPRKSDVYTVDNTSDAENKFLKLRQHHMSGSGTSFLQCMTDLYGIYHLIAQLSDDADSPPTPHGKIDEAKAYIEAHLADSSLSVELLAERAGISEVYFRKLFKAVYGTSPLAYINSVRVTKAKELLRYPFVSLEECAVRSGFVSLQYFCRRFKKLTGVTPLNYRKRVL